MSELERDDIVIEDLDIEDHTEENVTQAADDQIEEAVTPEVGETSDTAESIASEAAQDTSVEGEPSQEASSKDPEEARREDTASDEAAQQDTAKKPPQTSVISDLLYLVMKICIIALLVLVLFTFMFGVTRVRDTSMVPAVKEGDVVVYYRLQKDYVFGDLVALNYNGDTEIRRVVATAGDTVDVTGEGLVINGYIQQESNIYFETLPYTEGITYPVTLKEGEIFVLGDARDGATDSRIYGAVTVDSTYGKVMTILRRRNF